MSDPDAERVLFATIYPSNPHARSEAFVTRELMREYLLLAPAWKLEVLIVSAHQCALQEARTIMAEFPSVAARFVHVETEYAGARAEEIAQCKEELPERAMEMPWDWLLYMDADVWTSLSPVSDWMKELRVAPGVRFVQLRYALRTALESPNHTLGAYFHHRELLTRLPYWEVVFPKMADGRRTGAPDCLLHDYLERSGCEKVVPSKTTTAHFLNQQDIHLFKGGRCFSQASVRDAEGNWSRPWTAGPVLEHPIDAPPDKQSWMHPRQIAAIEGLLGPSDKVLEFGTGPLTGWLAGRVAEVQTVEHRASWVSKAIATAPQNVTLHWRRPSFPHHGMEPAQPNQFAAYIDVPNQLRTTFDACLLNGRARIECALNSAPWIRPGGWLFFHDWFPRSRYTDRLPELNSWYHFREDLSIRDTPQTLAIFSRKERTE